MFKALGFLIFLNVCLTFTDAILFGSEAENVPYQVSIQAFVNGAYRHVCGGAILSPTRVITAGFCGALLEGLNATVVGNTTDLNDPYSVRVNVIDINIHPEYSEQPLKNDVAMLITDYMELNDVTMKAIEVAKDTIGNFVSVRLSGWGATVLNSIPLTTSELLSGLNTTSKLKILDTLTVTTSKCGVKLLPPGFYCTLDVKGSGCNGDTGGPLVANFGGSVKLVGILAYSTYSFTCIALPNIFTILSPVLDWIYGFN